ncbi:uncharacterized protein BCR38DRAFT_405076 [Pseudomassariella vexata]|uniref:F-box domain-containing protein n=1 Tax=Pseudomassariella vexata TaxID=1141098 RepID=A0A1Y2EKK2_9PEZI|nr:uncharacterized protein BCR38DRAFT_405076 [Pseudomassariella vexata]ORY72068.1 hypothetical protein BCR38DRAFT_405076 [Pseudomassariella vexata]
MNAACLEKLPLELLKKIADYLPPCSVAAAGIANKEMQERVGSEFYQSMANEDRADFAKLLDRDFENIWCHWCETRHSPILSVLAIKGGVCKSPSDLTGFGSTGLPRNWHPNLLVGLAKYCREGRDTAELEALLSVPRKSQENHGVGSNISWESIVTNEHGMFARRVEVLFPLTKRCRAVAAFKQCCHRYVRLRFELIMKWDARGIQFRRGPTALIEPEGWRVGPVVSEVDGCPECHRDFRVMLRTPGESNAPCVYLTIWYYLGSGDFALDIVNRMQRPLRRRLGPGVGHVCRESGMFTEENISVRPLASDLEDAASEIEE